MVHMLSQNTDVEGGPLVSPSPGVGNHARSSTDETVRGKAVEALLTATGEATVEVTLKLRAAPKQ